MTPTNLRSPAILVPGLFLLTLLGLLLALATIDNPGGVVHGATLTVTNLNDTGAGSLRQAIADASPGDTIDFAVTGTITLTSGQLTINNDLVISGPGSGDLSISGNNASRVFNVTGGQVTISGVTVRDGNPPSNFDLGGGIFNKADLIVSSSKVTNNTEFVGGGIANQFGNLTVVESLITGNSAVASGGGVSNHRANSS